ncbi:MAG: PTS galactitol transporter subunit IIB [Anaerolineales bacterium]|jgi:PTS system galactitol-specific IIB component
MVKKRVLVACGTSIATATVAASAVADMAKSAGIDVEVAQCKAAEIHGKIQTFSPHVIIAMTPVPSDLGVPVFNGVPFLSGIGLDQLKSDLVEALKKD